MNTPEQVPHLQESIYTSKPVSCYHTFRFASYALS